MFLPATSPAYAVSRVEGSDAAAQGGSGSTLPREENMEEGLWLNADPRPGCVVVNVGEMCAFFVSIVQPCSS